MKPSTILLSLLLPISSYALETDNYLAWQVVLPDSADQVNDFMNSKIEEALADVNEDKDFYTCEMVTYEIANKFKTTPTSKSLEEFVGETLDKENIHPKHPKFLEISILKNTRFYLKHSGLSPNLQINGYYLGADKLSHFASTGRRYFQRYVNKIRLGSLNQEAVESAIRYGLLNETTVLGWWASGVFSYGDMEANYQGFLYYKRMCHSGENNYLSQDHLGKWHLVLKPDLRDYVNPYWDESYNQSYFSNASWTQVQKSISEKYCGMKLSPIVQDRFQYYSEAKHTSFSLEYIKKLQDEGYRNAPIPWLSQNIVELCEERAPGQEALAINEE